MKILHSILVIGTLVGVMQANEIATSDKSGVFIGVDGGAMGNMVLFKSVTTSGAGEQKGKFKDRDWYGNVGLKLGYYINGNNRIYLSYNYGATLQAKGSFVQRTLGNEFTNYVNARFQSHKITLGYDHIFNVVDNKNVIFGGYLGYGANVGKFHVGSTRSGGAANTLTPDRFNATYGSLLVGLNLGYMYNLNVAGEYYGDIEVGAKIEYLGSFASTKTIMVQTAGRNFPSKQKGSMGVLGGGFYVGYSYRF